MKICLLAQNLNTTDGGGRFSSDLVSGLKNKDFNIVVLSREAGQLSFFNFFKIRKIFKKSDIIHAIDIWPNGFYARLISFGLRKPIIVTALGTYSVAPFYSWRKSLVIWASKGVQMVAISEYTKEKIKKILPDLKIKVITPGFNLDFWGNSMVDEYGAIKLKPYILSVGALKSRKGYHNSIRAFSIAVKKYTNFNYVIVGQGEKSNYANNLKNLIDKSNLKSKIIFISSGIDDRQLLGFYKNAELFVLTPTEENNHFEGFGIVYLEAAASGLPVVAAGNSGAVSAVSDGYNGLLVPQNNPKAIAEAILKILENKEFKEKLGNNSREWAKNFSQEKIINQYLKIYNEITSNN